MSVTQRVSLLSNYPLDGGAFGFAYTRPIVPVRPFARATYANSVWQ
jgi:hypothetical protein